MSKIFHRDLAPEIEALLLSRAAPLTSDAAALRAWRTEERARIAALAAADFVVVWSVENGRQLERLGARLALVVPREHDETWPIARACWPDGSARYALSVDLAAWGALRSALDMGLTSAKQRAEIAHLLVARSWPRETLDVLESVVRLGGIAAAISFLEGDLCVPR